jgi:hypothetical protein
MGAHWLETEVNIGSDWKLAVQLKQSVKGKPAFNLLLHHLLKKAAEANQTTNSLLCIFMAQTVLTNSL